MRTSEWLQAWRSLRRRPAFLVSAILTLAFGAGITTAVFSLVDTVLLKDLPYPEADRLVTVFESSPSARDRTSLVAPGRLEDWQRLSRSFDALSGASIPGSTHRTRTSFAWPRAGTKTEHGWARCRNGSSRLSKTCRTSTPPA